MRSSAPAVKNSGSGLDRSSAATGPKNNAQGELHALEVGLHALRSGLEPKAYAEAVGQPRTSIQTRYNAARVASETDIGLASWKDRWSHLAEVHAAPRWLWAAVVDAMPDTVERGDVTPA